MSNILTEVGVKYAITRWKEKYHTEPDINSQDFKAFQKEVNRAYNQRSLEKACNDDNVPKYAETLGKIIDQKPQEFQQQFYNALTNLSKKGKVNLCNALLQGGKLSEDWRSWVQVIGNLYNSNKTESAEVTLEAMKESSKYPWISGLVNHRLFKEDDFNLDNFDASVAGAGGMSTNTSTQNSNTSTTDTGTEQGTDDFNLDDISSDNVDDLNIEPAGGAIDSIGGGMGDMGGEDDMMGAPAQDTPDYRVIDVIFDEKDPEASPRVKVQNVETGEIEIKDIFELDV